MTRHSLSFGRKEYTTSAKTTGGLETYYDRKPQLSLIKLNLVLFEFRLPRMIR